MKKIVLTIDYELYLGSRTGDVKSCMIEPTQKLSALLATNGSKMTVFWDILHYYKLLENQEKFTELKNDVLMIEKQILALAAEGHDIQLHLHPHWLDAIYANNKWNFDYKRFKLQNLSEEDDEYNINTITGCITITRKMLENLVRRVKPDYKVTTFRAGGYLIQPFENIRDSLIKNNILVDTSICPGLRYKNQVFSFDFVNFPKKNFYRFSDDPSINTVGGKFIELPIKTINIPPKYNLYFTYLRHVKYKKLKSEVKGTGAGKTIKPKKGKLLKLFNIFFNSKTYQFTTDGNFKEIILFMLKKVEEDSTMILHPKSLTSHTIELLNELTEKNKIKFVSVKDFLLINDCFPTN